MTIDRFPQEVVETLGHYVYRLIDPRNGETFYVGRGQGNRIFAHAKGAVDDVEQGAPDPKLRQINHIRGLGMDVAHIIHRHGMSEAEAKEVEAALIDAFPGLTNRVAGSGSVRGTKHVQEILLQYCAEEFEQDESLILISISQLWDKWKVYDAVRGLWRMDKERASQYCLVLAQVMGLVRGAFRPKKWMFGTPKNFPLHDWSGTDFKKFSKRICFDGTEAEPEVWQRYVGKRVPVKYMKKGAANPIRYLDFP